MTLTVTLPAVDGTLTNAVSVPEFPNVVPTALPLITTVEPLTKFDPSTVSSIVVPVCAEDGEIPVTTGVGATTVRVAPLEAPPPGP
jgi:hypothetical protein